MWSSDGTKSGTRRETSLLNSEAFSGTTPAPLWIGGRLLFRAVDTGGVVQLWAKTGTSIVPLKPTCNHCPSSVEEAQPIAVAGRAVFTGMDATFGTEAWTTDGTPSGTKLLVDSCPGSCDGSPVVIAPVPGGVLFRTLTSVWYSDAQPGGTIRLAALPTSQLGPLDSALVAINGHFVFTGFDPVYGFEAFVAEKTPESGRIISNFTSDEASSGPSFLTPLGSRAVFEASFGDSQPPGLFATDGTTTGTSQLSTAAGRHCTDYSPCAPYSPIGSLGYFSRATGDAHQVWRTDGTFGGTTQLTFDPAGVYTPLFARANGAAVILNSVSGGVDLWTSNGTPAGTRLAFRLPSEVEWASHSTTVGNNAYFVGHRVGSANLWRTDGTPAGTVRITSFSGGDYTIGDPMITGVGDEVYFVALKQGIGGELWRTPGQPGGTSPVSLAGQISDLVPFQGVLYFSAHTGEGRRGLLHTNGPLGGLTLLLEFATGDSSPTALNQLRVWNDQLYFVAKTTERGAELWRTDGTFVGSSPVTDLVSGPGSPVIQDLTATPLGLFFTADDGVHGRELWRSDGTSAGTRLVEDLAPGLVSSFPRE